MRSGEAGVVGRPRSSTVAHDRPRKVTLPHSFRLEVKRSKGDCFRFNERYPRSAQLSNVSLSLVRVFFRLTDHQRQMIIIAPIRTGSKLFFSRLVRVLGKELVKDSEDGKSCSFQSQPFRFLNHRKVCAPHKKCATKHVSRFLFEDTSGFCFIPFRPFEHN
jgi:hypothetical protein